jgi:hypothetical protein
VRNSFFVVDAVVSLSSRAEGEQASLVIARVRFFKVTGKFVRTGFRELVEVFYNVGWVSSMRWILTADDVGGARSDAERHILLCQSALKFVANRVVPKQQNTQNEKLLR